MCLIGKNIWTGIGGHDGPWRKKRKCFVKFRPVVCKVERCLARRGKDSGAVCGQKRGFKVAICRGARAHYLFLTFMYVIEEESYITQRRDGSSRDFRRGFSFGLLRSRGRSAWRLGRSLDGKVGNVLRLTVVQQSEVFLVKVAHGAALRIAY